ncbi:MlaD family protein [Nocardia sp. NPDC057440]|uniref:MlaD family protein n=1 Tax=Nocardia sp. NPDC057440 TaxID=3346134 RepID=UPI0036723178
MRSKQQTDGPRWVIARSIWRPLRLKIAGAALVVAMAAVIAGVLSMYSGRYISTASVTVDAPRAGLVLDPDARVKFRGVEIGRVAAIARAGDRVRLRLDLDPDLLRLVEEIFGGRYPGAYFNSSFMFAAEPYKYPDDLPKVNATGGPHCHGVDDRVPGSHSDYIVTDTGEGRPFIPSTTPHPNSPPVFELLFAGLPGMGGR